MKHVSFEICKNCFLRPENYDLKENTRAELTSRRVSRSYRAGSCLLSSEALPTQFYCLRQGRVDALSQDASGGEKLIASYNHGHIFPLKHLFETSADGQEFVAAENVNVCQFPITKFKELLNVDPVLAVYFTKLAYQESLAYTERISVLLEKSAENRVMRALKYFKKSDGSCNLSRREISLWTHLTVETVIRTLSELTERGLISKTKKSIILLDD